MKKFILLIIFLNLLGAETTILNEINSEKILSVEESLSKEEFSGKLIFKNGDNLSGKLLEYASNEVVWKHPQALQNLVFKNSQIKEIFFSKYETNFLTKRKTEVRLINGDTIFGDLVEFNDLELIIDTTYAGRLTINRIAVHAMRPASQLDYNLYKGPKDLKKWYQPNSNVKKWTVHNNKLILITQKRQSSSIIGRDFKFSDKFQISFDYKWKGNASLAVYLFVKDLKNYSTGNYRIQLSNGYASMNKSVNKRNHSSLGHQSNIQGLRGTQAKIVIKVDRDASLFHLYVNEVLVKIFSDDFGAKVLGNNLMFSSPTSSEIINLSIDRWDGAVNQNFNFSGKVNKKDKIVFTNNDSVSGTFKNMNKQTIEFESSFGLLPNLNLDRVSMIIFANQKPQEQKFSENDVQLYFNDKRLTFELDKINNGVIYGKSLVFGNLSFNLKGFKKIDFQPKN